jgi:glucosamine-6-phosphate deaminase
VDCSESVCVLVTGASKQKILKQVLQGPVSPAVPASYLRTHPHVLFMTDEDAAATL